MTERAPSTIFVISPARCSGRRADILATSIDRPASRVAPRLRLGSTSTRSALGTRLRTEGASVGDVFTWLSALYFRGKLTYATRFARPPAELPGTFVMLPGIGLRPPAALIDVDDFRAMGATGVEGDGFIEPLRRDAAIVTELYGDARVVLLGSVATGKYRETLIAEFGARLLFPESFVGRGDMSRGGLLLRAANSGEELAYIAVAGATLHGTRPPKLPRL